MMTRKLKIQPHIDNNLDLLNYLSSQLIMSTERKLLDKSSILSNSLLEKRSVKPLMYVDEGGGWWLMWSRSSRLGGCWKLFVVSLPRSLQNAPTNQHDPITSHPDPKRRQGKLSSFSQSYECPISPLKTVSRSLQTRQFSLLSLAH